MCGWEILIAAIRSHGKTSNSQQPGEELDWNKTSPRIRGGQEAKLSDVPYIAMIKVWHPHNKVYQPLCAGAILSEVDILTNAACASECNVTTNCKVFVGKVKIDDDDDDGQEIQIRDTVWHESYIALYMNRIGTNESRGQIIDLGMIHTEMIIMSETVQSINLPIQDLKDGRDVIIAGWGDNESQHKVLQYAKVAARKCLMYENNSIGRYACTQSNAIFACESDMGATMAYSDVNGLVAVGSFHNYKSCTGGK
ncbi:serine protease ami-like [Contarinia nasturtii]|uniref:serine protease ami-like n=1 Tax=Contarinia nasturtii TaxID=265458 RepID=UPI0012D38DA0|nr:serine protease ami-like [Contarinia nasturtii]